MILTPAQRKAFERAVAKSNEVLRAIEVIRELTEIDPSLTQRYEDLKAQRDYAFKLASKVLHLDRVSDANR